jgi:AcrR family transcriptional regulator
VEGSVDIRPTGLEKALVGDGAGTRPTPLDALELARRHWLAGERIDMGAMAAELGISRATLYTWVGSKERLIGEVLWSFAEQGVRQSRESAAGSGADYIVDVVERFIHLNAGFEPLRRFISEDPELALRLLTSKDGPVQGRMIAVARELLTEQIEAGALRPPVDVDSLAYLMVRVAESFLYSDLITGTEPDVNKAVEVVRVLLHAPPLPARPKSRRRARRR